MSRAEHVFVPMADGVRLAATLYLPACRAGRGRRSWRPCPTARTTSPRPTSRSTGAWRRAGYAVCRLDVRGTGSREGIADDEYPARRAAATCDGHRLAGRRSDWSTGAVGMYGTSYSGFNSLQLACERPPALQGDHRHLRDRRPLRRRRPLLRRRAQGSRPGRLPDLHDRDERAAAGAGALRRRLARGVARRVEELRAVDRPLARAPARRRLLAARLAAPRLRRASSARP